GCNHFGIARFPQENNIVFKEMNYQYSFADWIQWSMKLESDQKTKEDRERKLIVFPEKKEIRQVDEPWFDMLLHKANIVGGEGR
ncbi:replication protein RepR, partial [Enterococcus faecalis]